MSGILRNTYFTSPSTGLNYWIGDDGKAVPDELEQEVEGPCCSICDGLGHGFPGGGPCPLEERGSEDARQDEEREERINGVPASKASPWDFSASRWD